MIRFQYKCNRCDGRIEGATKELVDSEHFRCGGRFVYVGSKEYMPFEEKDKINPSHYTSLSPQPIDVIESWGLGFHLGSVLTYIARNGRKEGETALDDLMKARWYLDREIRVLEGLNERTIKQS